jgi:hypothetical protein
MFVASSPPKKKKGHKTIPTSAHGCGKCNDVDQRGSALEQVGEAEDRTYLEGKAVETETRFKCKSCGSEWVNYVVDGLGGYGSFWIPR